MGAEPSGLGRHSMPAQQVHEATDERPCHLRQRCVDEGWTASLARVSVKGELGDHDRFPLYIPDGKIGLPLVVLEHAQIGDLLGKVVCLLIPITVTYTQ